MKKPKKLIAVLICMAMAAAVLPAVTAWAEEPSEEFNEIFKYYGTQASTKPIHKFDKVYTGEMRIEFDLVVNSFSDGVIAFSNNSGIFGPEAIAIQTTGSFMARNGDGSGSATQEIFYTPELGETYHFSITTDTVQHVWSGTMTTPDGETVTVADNYGYRTNQDSIDRIIMLRNTSTYAYVDDVELSNLKIYGNSERKCGDNLTWTLDSEGTLTISGTGDMWDWTDSTSNLAPWKNNYNSLIKTVNIEPGVSKIGQYAFYYCPNLASVTIPDSVESIDGYGLSYCPSLTSVTIPSSVTYIGWGAFANSSVTDIYYGGSEEEWSNINISEGNSYLSSVTIHYLEGSDTGIIASGECGDNLTWTLDDEGSLTISGTGDMWNWSDSTSNLAPWKNNYNSLIKAVNIESGVSKIGQYAFYYCPNLASVTIPDSVESIDGYGLSYCPSLTSVTIPSSVTYIGWGAFRNSAVTDIYYGGTEEEWSNINISEGNDYLADLTIHCLSTDPVSVTAVTLDKTTAELTVGESTILTAAVAPEGAANKAVTWKSSDTSVATVSNGVITAKSAGTATITVTTSDGGYTASCIVAVKAPLAKYTADIIVGNVSGRAGEEVTIPVLIANNPGIAGFNLTINYDKARLIPVSVNIGSILTGSITSNIQQGGDMKEYDFITSYWDNPSDITADGELFNVTFKIADDAEDGEIPVTVTYENGDTSNQNYEDIELNITNGGVTVKNIIMGDVFQDGEVNTKDGVRLRQYLAKWDVELTSNELAAADVLSDGTVNTKDGVRLRQYLAKWDISLEEAQTASLFEISLQEAGVLAFEVGSVEVQEGEYIDIPVNITENSGVAGFNMQLNYDKTKLTPVSISLGSALEGSITSNIQQGGDMTRYDFVTAYWDNPSNVTSTGEAFVVRFLAADNVYGEIPVSLSYDENDVPCNQDFEELEIKITDGTVTVKEPNKCGDNLKWTLNDEGTLTISGTGEMWDYYNAIDLPWYDSRSSITSVIVKGSVSGISDCAFNNCTNLISVNIPCDLDYSDLGYAFDGCSALESIEVVGETDNGLRSIDGVLYVVETDYGFGTPITTLALIKYPANKPDSSYRITGDITYMFDGAFDGCKNLAEFYVVKNHDYFYAEDGVLFDKYGTDLIKYPPKKEGTAYSIPEDVTTVRYNAFENSSLESIAVPQYTEALSDAFCNCASLTEINVAETNETYSSVDGVLFNKDKTELITYPAGKIGAYKIPSGVTDIECAAFLGCTGLTSVFIPNGIEYIDWNTFSGCTSLTSVYLPYGIYEIVDDAFDGAAVTDVYYGGSEEEWSYIDIWEDGNDAILNAEIHYNCTDFAEITYVEAEVADGEVIVYADAVSIGDAVPFAVGYSEDGNVIFTGEADEDGCVSLPAETKTVKVFVWESLESMRPLCEAKTVTVQQ